MYFFAPYVGVGSCAPQLPQVRPRDGHGPRARGAGAARPGGVAVSPSPRRRPGVTWTATRLPPSRARPLRPSPPRGTARKGGAGTARSLRRRSGSGSKGQDLDARPLGARRGEAAARPTGDRDEPSLTAYGGRQRAANTVSANSNSCSPKGIWPRTGHLRGGQPEPTAVPPTGVHAGPRNRPFPARGTEWSAPRFPGESRPGAGRPYRPARSHPPGA